MKKMKQIMSWLLVLVMMISLMPANLARAEGEDSTEEVTKYSVYVSPYVYMVDTCPPDEYNNSFSVIVPEGQTGVEADTESENYWYVEDGNTLTIQVTIPEDCMYDYLSLRNGGVVMEGISFEKVADTDNTYAVTVSPNESMSLEVYDGTYYSVYNDYITMNFNCYIASDANATSENTISYVKAGDSYVICLDTALESISDESLSLSINDTAVSVDQLEKRDAGWYYTVNNVTTRQNVKVYETGTALTVTMPDLSSYGYEIYDATGENKIDWENGPTTYEVQSGSDLTFQVKPIENVEETLPFGLYWGDDELTSEDGTTYTISAVTWNASVDAYRKYLVSVAEDSDMKFFPCTSDGTLLTNTSVSEYYYRECATGYFKLDGIYSEYEVSDDTGVITPDSNGVYSVSVDTFDKTLTIAEVQKYTLSVSGAELKMIPCTAEGEALSEAVTEYQYVADTNAYFKMEEADFKFNVKNGAEVIGADENGVYCVYIEDASVELTIVPYYHVALNGMDGCYLNAGNENYYYDWTYDEDTEITYYIVEDNMHFDVVVYSEYNADNMTVTLKNADGTTHILTSTGSVPSEEEEATVYSFVADSITQDAEIIVEGIYSNDTRNLILHYSASDMRDIGVNIEVLDQNGDALEQEDYNPDETKVDVHDGLQYTLSISGEESVLETLKITADGNVLVGNIEDGVWTAEVDSIYDIYIVSGEQYYISYECDDEVGNIYVTQYGLDYTTDMIGYYPAGEISFWIQENSDGVTAENARVVSIKDRNGNDVEYTTQENVEVDDYGKKRTVYTVDLATDITITITGSQRLKYDVYLPIADNSSGYTISKLYTKEQVEVEEDIWEEQNVYLTGTDMDEDKCTQYEEIDWDTYVYFDVTAATSKGTPYVQTASGELMVPYEQEELDASTTKYTYQFCVDQMTEISVSVNTVDIQVEAIGDQQYYARYNADFESWRIYTEDPDAGEEEPQCLVEVYGLPAVVDMDDKDRQYQVYFDVYGDQMVDMDYNSDLFLKAENQDGEQKALSLQYGSMPGEEYYTMPVADGYTKLILDMTKLEPRNGKVTFTSYRDDMEIAIVGEEGTDYKVVGSKANTYKAVNKQLKFSVTAEDAADFDENYFLGLYGYELDGDYVESADGKTRTYTIVNVSWDSFIKVSYPATVAFEECEFGGIYTNVIGDNGGEDEYGNFEPGTFAAGQDLMLNFYVKSGYDVESVKVVQKYVDEEGNEQITEYTDFDDYASWDDRTCDVILQPGLNTFSIEEAQAKIYTMSLPTSSAYSIELVNGSKTTVDYKGTFSFKVIANDGYDLSKIVVTANGQKMTPDVNGVYTIKNVNQDYDIGITGYKTRSYIVTFKDYDGKVLKTEKLEHGKAATAPASPARDGYTFTGWNTTFTKVTKDMTVIATYKPILVSKLKITGDYKNLAVGKEVQLKVTATPVNALNADVVWTTSNKKWATVSAKGKVKALKAGAGKTVTITATAKDGSGVKATYKIKIYKNAIKKIKLSAKSKSVKAGKKVTIKAKLTPNKSIFKTLKWTSSNTKWATVNSKGVVTTKKAGKGKTVKITAQAMDGSGKKAFIKIKIKK